MFPNAAKGGCKIVRKYMIHDKRNVMMKIILLNGLFQYSYVDISANSYRDNVLPTDSGYDLQEISQANIIMLLY